MRVARQIDNLKFPTLEKVSGLIRSALAEETRELREALQEGLLLAIMLRTFADCRDEVDKNAAIPGILLIRMGAFMRNAERLLGESQ